MCAKAVSRSRKKGEIDPKIVAKAIKEQGIDPEKFAQIY